MTDLERVGLERIVPLLQVALHTHPRLRGAERIELTCTPDAVVAVITAGGRERLVHLHWPGWWIGALRTREDLAEVVVGQVVEVLRERVERSRD